MKIRHFTLTMLLFIASTALFAQDSIPNGGFERWTQGGANFFDPNGWHTPDPLTSAINQIVVSPDSATVHSGKFSAKLVTKTGAGYIIPGFVTTGSIDPSSQNIVGGILIHSRPLSVQGWYQYIPSGSDTGGMGVRMLDLTSTAIGNGSLDVSAAATWTSFTMPITYTSAAIPDTAQVSIYSSSHHGTVGSVLLLDDVSYSYIPTGIDEHGMVQVRVYPTPANDIEYFSIDNALELKNAVIQFYNVQGQLVKEEEVGAHSFSVNTKNLAVGYYSYQLINDGKIAGNGKTVIQR